jgi:glycosyltransferase involved in cell wall biosynthesis
MVRALARDLSAHGIDAHVATTDDNGPTRLRVPHGVPILEEGVTYWYFPRQTRLYTVSWPLGSWLAAHVADFDLVHIHALFSFATLPAAYWAHRRGVPYVVRPLGTLNRWGMENRRPWLKKASFRLVESRVVRHASLMHYTSEQERIEAERLAGRTPAAVIPNALPRAGGRRLPGAFRARYPALAGRRLVLFLSRLDRKKGVDLLLRGFAALRTRVPAAALVVAGDGEAAFVGRLKEQARSLGIESDVIWTGFLAGAEKEAALADAEVFVLPSFSENFGIAVLEALASGVPVVVSEHVAIHDEVVRESAGLAVPCDPAALADAIATILDDRGLARAMSARAVQLARSRYSPDAVTRRMIGAYNAIAP